MINEGTGFIEICAILDGELEGTVDATIFTVAGSAQGKCTFPIAISVNISNSHSFIIAFLLLDVLDFVLDGGPGSQFIQFSEPGEQCVNISIEMDGVLENTETFSVILGSGDDRVKVLQRSATVYILDSESTCTLNKFAASLLWNVILLVSIFVLLQSMQEL